MKPEVQVTGLHDSLTARVKLAQLEVSKQD